MTRGASLLTSFHSQWKSLTMQPGSSGRRLKKVPKVLWGWKEFFLAPHLLCLCLLCLGQSIVNAYECEERGCEDADGMGMCLSVYLWVSVSISGKCDGNRCSGCEERGGRSKWMAIRGERGNRIFDSGSWLYSVQSMASGLLFACLPRLKCILVSSL